MAATISSLSLQPFPAQPPPEEVAARRPAHVRRASCAAATASAAHHRRALFSWIPAARVDYDYSYCGAAESANYVHTALRLRRQT
jgi:hypothetical protein